MTNSENKKILRPDFCVIGAGSGGLSFAAGAVQMGATVVLVESKKMGGDCLNSGCVPSKALIAASKIGHKILTADHFGWSVPKTRKSRVDFQKVHDHVHAVIAQIAPHDSVERFEKLGVHVILEAGHFTNATTLATDRYEIQAKRFVIATGSIPFIPPIPGLKDVPFYTNETIFGLTTLPDHLVVIGGGPIGIEMAQAFRRFGSKVTVLEAFSALPKDDAEITTKLKNILMDEGVTLHEHAQISSITQNEKGVEIHYQTPDLKKRIVMASHVMVATGRRPHIQNLNLDAANIKFSPRGIEVSPQLRTSNPRVYAIGDCTGGYQFTHVAGYHAGLVIRNSIFKLGAKVETQAIPWVTYTDPELAHVGFLEAQLQDKKIPYRVLQMNFDENDRAQAEKSTAGTIKILASPKGHVLGATILGPHAGELIYPWVMAIQNKLKVSAITSSIAPYPTLTDLSKRVAGSFFTPKIFSPSMQRFVKFMMRWSR